MVGAARAAMDLLATLGGSTLAVSAIVLGASMFPPNGNSGRGQEPLRPPAAARSISVSASTDHPTRFSYDPTASYDGVFCLPNAELQLKPVWCSCPLPTDNPGAPYPRPHRLHDGE